MNWAEEDYVRIYKRNTVEIAAWGWETRAVFWELMRLADEDGSVPCPSVKGLCALLMMPVEVVEPALTTLCQGGPMDKLENGFQIRNYLAAQRTPRQDAARKREERRRRLAAVVQDNGGQERTTLDNVTPRSAPNPLRSAPLRSESAPNPPDRISESPPEIPHPRKRGKNGARTTIASQETDSEGSEQAVVEASGSVVAVASEAIAAVEAAFRSFGHVCRPGPTSLHRRHIAARVAEGWSLEELVAAVNGNHADEWHAKVGKHELSYVFRNSEQVERFARIAAQGGNVDMAKEAQLDRIARKYSRPEE